MRNSKVIFLNNMGSSILLVMSLISLVSVSIITMGSFFDNQLKIQISKIRSAEVKIIFQDSYVTLSDQNNCNETFSSLFGNKKIKKETIEDQTVSVLKNKVQALYTSGATYNGIKIEKIGFSDFVKKSDFIYEGSFLMEFERKELTGSRKSIKKFPFQLTTDSIVGPTYQRFKSCQTIGEFFKPVSLNVNPFPECDDGDLLVYSGESYACSSDSNYSQITQIQRYTMPCNINETGGAYEKLFGKRCATLQVTKNLPRYRDFWVATPPSTSDLRSQPKVSEGVLLQEFSYKSISKAKVFIDSIIPVFYTGGTDSSSTYAASFIAVVFAKASGASSWQVVGFNDIWNPFALPWGRMNYFDASGVERKNIPVPNLGNDFGGSSVVRGEFSVQALMTYNIQIRLMSLSFYKPQVDLSPKLFFGTLQFNDNYAQGTSVLTEVKLN